MHLAPPTRHESTLDFAISWVQFLAPPIIWSMHFLVLYLLASVTCGVLTTDWLRVEMGAASALAEVLIVGSTIGSFLHWRSRDYEGWPHESEGLTRESFMAYWGVAIGVLFFVGVIFTSVGFTTLYECR